RQAFVPGILFGLNITAFFAGATHNTVANVELIGSMAPFLVVPIGARFFQERLNVRALGFALLAFCGVIIVLFAAPPSGDASLKGNLLGLLAMVLWASYIATTRYYRRDMDVVTFMATIMPIGALAVVPIAIIHGHVLDVTPAGWWC